jgi:hypothetical protein
MNAYLKITFSGLQLYALANMGRNVRIRETSKKLLHSSYKEVKRVNKPVK